MIPNMERYGCARNTMLNKFEYIQKHAHALRELQFEVTHKCNKMCSFCDHRIAHGTKYVDLTKDEYKYILDCISHKDKIKKIWLGGGEPLMYPFINWLIVKIRHDFPNAIIDMLTNGSLLDSKLDHDLIGLLNLVISYYPRFNDTIVNKYKELPNVYIQDKSKPWDPYINPNLSEETAKEHRQNCLHQVRLVGAKMYGCCLAEGIERYYKTDPVHVRFSNNWKQDFFNLPTWKACQHCFRGTGGLNADIITDY